MIDISDGRFLVQTTLSADRVLEVLDGIGKVDVVLDSLITQLKPSESTCLMDLQKACHVHLRYLQAVRPRS